MNEAIQYWELITAFLLPLIIAALTRQTWSSAWKSVVMFTVSVIVVVGQMFVRDELGNWEDPTASVLKVVAFTIAFYQGLWKPTGIAPTIESATTPTTTTGTRASV